MPAALLCLSVANPFLYSSLFRLLVADAICVINCNMMKGFSSEAFVRIGGGSDCGIGGVGGELQEPHAQFLICR